MTCGPGPVHAGTTLFDDSVRFLVYPQFIWTHSLVCLLFIFWVFLSRSMWPHSFDVSYRGYNDPFPR
jgi:hypothetical protein